MALDLVDYEKKSAEAVMAFWGNREKARQKQIEAGKADQGERAGVTAGKTTARQRSWRHRVMRPTPAATASFRT